MKTRWKMFLAAAVAGMFSSLPAPASANGPILRIAADFFNFDGTETATAAPVFAPDGTLVDGTTVFRKSVFVPFGVNTIYVTISTTGDTHDGAALYLSCRVDGAPCNPGSGGAGGAPPGWINLQKHKNYALGLFGDGGGGAGDMHDNSIHYTWCMKRESGPATVELKLASSGPDFETGTGATPPIVFFEAAHVFIDASRIAGENRCTPAPRLPETAAAAASSNQR
jgi:hypothetical protein